MEKFGFNKNVFGQMIENTLEGSLNPGKLVRHYYKYATNLGAIYLTGADVKDFFTDQKTGLVNVVVKNHN